MEAAGVRVFKDQMLREVRVKSSKRIVSLVPSQTELLLDLGLTGRVVGRTRFCQHPKEKVSGIATVGGTKTVHTEKIIALRPDLLLGNKEENTKAVIEALEEHCPVWLSDIHTLSDAYAMIEQVGVLTHTQQKADTLRACIQARMEGVRGVCSGRVLYLIWRRPWMSVGGDTFISHMLEHAGFSNVLKGRTRYPSLSLEDMQALRPRYVFLSSEPYPFTEKHIPELLPHLGEAQHVCVDGSAFAWYGSRLAGFAATIQGLAQVLSKT